MREAWTDNPRPYQHARRKPHGYNAGLDDRQYRRFDSNRNQCCTG